MSPLEIRRLRYGLDWTQEKMAEHIGVSQALISAWESGRRQPGRPELQLLEQLSQSVNAPESGLSQHDSRTQILRAALEVLAFEGAQRLNFGRIADEVGVSLGGIEHHFATRSELIDALIQAYRDKLDASMMERLQELSNPHDPEAKCTAYIEQTFAPDEPADVTLHRAALLAAATSDNSVMGPVASWYKESLKRVVQKDNPEQLLTLIATDAVWIFELFGLLELSPEEKSQLQHAAKKRVASNP